METALFNYFKKQDITFLLLLLLYLFWNFNTYFYQSLLVAHILDLISVESSFHFPSFMQSVVLVNVHSHETVVAMIKTSKAH